MIMEELNFAELQCEEYQLTEEDLLDLIEIESSLSVFDEETQSVPLNNGPIMDENDRSLSCSSLTSLDITTNEEDDYCEVAQELVSYETTGNTKAKRKRKSPITSSVSDGMAMAQMKVLLNASASDSQKLEAITFFMTAIDKLKESFTAKIFTNDVIQALIRILQTSTTKELMEKTIILIDLMVVFGIDDKMSELFIDNDLIPMLLEFIHGNVAWLRLSSIHLMTNMIVSDENILRLLLNKRLLSLLNEICIPNSLTSSNAAATTVTDVKTLESISIMIRNIFQTMKTSEDYVKQVLRLLETLIAHRNPKIKCNILKTLIFICESEDDQVLELIVSSNTIMKAILELIQGNKMRYVLDALRIVAPIAAGTNCPLLLQYQPSVIRLIKRKLKAKAIPVSNRTYGNILYECYRTIANLCADDDTIIESILQSKIYDILIANVIYYCDPSRQYQGLDQHSQQSFEIYEQNCIAIAFAANGANEQQMQTFLSKGLLNMFHIILNYRPFYPRIIKEVLIAMMKLLDNTANIVSQPIGNTLTNGYVYHEMIVEELSRKEYTTIHHLVMHGKDPGIVELAKTIKHLFDRFLASKSSCVRGFSGNR